MWTGTWHACKGFNDTSGYYNTFSCVNKSGWLYDTVKSECLEKKEETGSCIQSFLIKYQMLLSHIKPIANQQLPHKLLGVLCHHTALQSPNTVTYFLIHITLQCKDVGTENIPYFPCLSGSNPSNDRCTFWLPVSGLQTSSLEPYVKFYVKILALILADVQDTDNQVNGTGHISIQTVL